MKLTRRPKGYSRIWGVARVAVATDDGPVWVGHWMQLEAPGQVSLEFDSDPAECINHAAWRRARQAFGVPQRIVTLDEATAAEVRRLVPRKVEVVVAEEPQLRELVDGYAVPLAEGSDDAGRHPGWATRELN